MDDFSLPTMMRNWQAALPCVRSTYRHLRNEAALRSSEVPRPEPPDDCLKQVVEHHPADVASGLWQEIKNFLEREWTGA